MIGLRPGAIPASRSAARSARPWVGRNLAGSPG